MPKYRVVDLFCGIGGFSYGFEMTKKFEVVCAADIWETAINTYKLNHIRNNNIDILLQDLTQMDENHWTKYVGNIDIIIAGPPCQGFSMSGKRKVGDERNSLFEEVIKISNIVQPKYVVIENVVGLLSMTTVDGVNIKDLILSEFNRIGYTANFKVLNAADYGVPQARKRVVFIASKEYPITFPEPKLAPEKYVTVGDALGNIPADDEIYDAPVTPFQKEMSGRKEIFNHQRRKSNDLVTKRISFIPQGGNWKDIPIELGTGGGVHSNAYKRLDPKKPSITIKHAAKAMIIHPTENRILTVREVARLQSFGDDFILTGSNSDQHQQLANAVPPLLGKAIAAELSKNISEHDDKKE